MLASGLNIIAGIWLIISPFVLGFTNHNGAQWDCIIVGVIVAIIAAIRTWGPPRTAWLAWVNVILGIWMIVSPWIFGVSDVNAILWNGIISGIVVIVLAAWSALAVESRTV
jgi:hypothetical protein